MANRSPSTSRVSSTGLGLPGNTAGTAWESSLPPLGLRSMTASIHRPAQPRRHLLHESIALRQIRTRQNVPMTISADDSGPVRIVTAVLRDGDRVLLCHRSAGRRWYPEVWDLPGGHVEEGEDPKESLVRELREELGITASEPSSPPMHEIRTATFDMQIRLIDRWTGTPVNAAPDEHDAVAWFETSDLDSLCLAHLSYLSMLTAVLVG